MLNSTQSSNNSLQLDQKVNHQFYMDLFEHEESKIATTVQTKELNLE